VAETVSWGLAYIEKIFGLENGEENIQIINADICLLLYLLFITNARRGTYFRKSINEKWIT
jgi:hypothetical protein